MLTSRAIVASRLVAGALKAKLGAGHATQTVRNSSNAWNYREGPKSHSKKTMFWANAAGGFMWWWVIWHLWHEPEHLTGEFPYPDTSKWTNQELGIPPDSESE